MRNIPKLNSEFIRQDTVKIANNQQSIGLTNNAEIDRFLRDVSNAIIKSNEQRKETDNVLLDTLGNAIINELGKIYQEDNKLQLDVSKFKQFNNATLQNNLLSVFPKIKNNLFDEQAKIQKYIQIYKDQILNQYSVKPGGVAGFSPFSTNIFTDRLKYINENVFKQISEKFISIETKLHELFESTIKQQQKNIQTRSRRYQAGDEIIEKILMQRRKTVNPFKYVKMSLQVDALLAKRKIVRTVKETKKSIHIVKRAFGLSRESRRVRQRIRSLNQYKREQNFIKRYGARSEKNDDTTKQQTPTDTASAIPSLITTDRRAPIKPIDGTPQTPLVSSNKNKLAYDILYTNTQKILSNNLKALNANILDSHNIITEYVKQFNEILSPRGSTNSNSIPGAQKTNSVLNIGGGLFMAFTALLGIGFLTKFIVPFIKKHYKKTSNVSTPTMSFPEVTDDLTKQTIGGNVSLAPGVDIIPNSSDLEKQAVKLRDELKKDITDIQNGLDNDIAKLSEELGKSDAETIQILNSSFERLNTITDSVVHGDDLADFKKQSEEVFKQTIPDRQNSMSMRRGDESSDAHRLVTDALGTTGINKLGDQTEEKRDEFETRLRDKLNKAGDSQSDKFNTTIDEITDILNNFNKSKLILTGPESNLKEQYLDTKNPNSAANQILTKLTEFKKAFNTLVSIDEKNLPIINYAVKPQTGHANNILNEITHKLAAVSQALSFSNTFDYLNKVDKLADALDNFYSIDNKIMSNNEPRDVMIVNKSSFNSLLASIDLLDENLVKPLNELNIDNVEISNENITSVKAILDRLAG